MSIFCVMPNFVCRLLVAIFVRPLVGTGCLLHKRWEVLGFSVIDLYNIDFVWLFLLSLLLCLLVGVLFEVAVITIMPYCPLMS